VARALKIAAVEILSTDCEMTGERTLVRITTEDGITGLGQSGGWGFPKGVVGVLEELAPLLIGADPFRIEHLWHRSYRARPFRGNLLCAAVSAIDLALWDIKGKAVDLPVWELLGGRTRDRVRLHVLVGGGTPDEIVSSVDWAVAEGFTAVKFDPLVHGYEDLSMGRLVASACEMAAAAREAGGAEVDLVFELHRKLDPATSVVVCNALAQFQPLFIEDPIQIDSIKTQAEIGRQIDSPIALGERLSSIWEFSELLSHDVPILIRPDVGLAGGLSGCRKIAAIAEAHHCGVAPHNFLGPGLTAPTLQLCTVIPNLVTMEYLPLDEDATSSSAAFDSAVVRHGGYCDVPDTPGLGVSLVDKHARLVRLVDHPYTDEALLRADGSVVAANWANGAVAASN
jgi:galactonate dehydratase